MLLAYGTCRGMAGADPEAGKILAERHAALGPLVGSERRGGGIFGLPAVAWIWPGHKPFSDAAIGLLGATLLFVVPAGAPHGGRALLEWDEAKTLPWDVL